MATFAEANQARLSLKMKLSQYSWYLGSSVEILDDDYIVVISTNHVNDRIRKLVPIVHNNVSIKTEVN